MAIVIGIATLVAIPTVFGLPAMIVAVPPLMVAIPTACAFGVQIAAPVIGLSAALAIVGDGVIQPRFRLFHGTLAMGSAIVGGRGRSRHKECKRGRSDDGGGDFSQS